MWITETWLLLLQNVWGRFFLLWYIRTKMVSYQEELCRQHSCHFKHFGILWKTLRQATGANFPECRPLIMFPCHLLKPSWSTWNLVRTIQATEEIHSSQFTKILANNELTDEVPIFKGTCRGCPLSPLLFISVSWGFIGSNWKPFTYKWIKDQRAPSNSMILKCILTSNFKDEPDDLF